MHIQLDKFEDQLSKLSTKHHTNIYAADDIAIIFANLSGWITACGDDETEADDATSDTKDDAAAMFALLSGWKCVFCDDDDTDDGGADGCCCLTCMLLMLQWWPAVIALALTCWMATAIAPYNSRFSSCGDHID